MRSIITVLGLCCVTFSAFANNGPYVKPRQVVQANVPIVQYTLGNGYSFDNDFDYYDGISGKYVGNTWYVYKKDGSYFPAPSPKYKNHRYTQRGWNGYHPHYEWEFDPKKGSWNDPKHQSTTLPQNRMTDKNPNHLQLRNPPGWVRPGTILPPNPHNPMLRYQR
jgi:hypothetical protein